MALAWQGVVARRKILWQVSCNSRSSVRIRVPAPLSTVFTLPMKDHRLAALLSLLAMAVPPSVQAQELGQLQRESLSHLFFSDNPLPPPPSAEEIEKARHRVRRARRWERRLLRQLYPDDAELWAYAIRDTDADGVLDFRVSDYYGRFLEGDTDLDGDGIDNVLDAEPYLVGSPAQSMGLPASVDWALNGKSDEMAAIQRQLFEKHRVLLVERSAEFTPELAESVLDVITRVYGRVFDEDGVLTTLRIVATEESSLLEPEDEAGAYDFAQVLPATQTLEIYRRGIDAAPVIQLGFLAHEIGHNIQFSLDYDRQRQEEIFRRNYFAAPHFFELVEPYGWSIVETRARRRDEYRLFRPQYLSQEPYEYHYWEEPVEDWAAWLAAIFEEVGEKRYLEDERIKELHIVGDYSLTGPWEWYSDQIIAYLYIAMLDSLVERCSPSDWNTLRRAFQSETVEAEWPYFRFENARGGEIQAHFREVYPLAEDDVSYMADAYLLPLHPTLCPPSNP